MTGFPWLYVIDTSPRTDYVLSLAVAAATAATTVWAWAVGVSGWAIGALLGLTLLLLATSAYARLLWRKDRARIETNRLLAERLRSYR